MEGNQRPPTEDLAYIKYSAKELLFLHGQKLDNIQAAVHSLELSMVSKADLAAVEAEVDTIKSAMGDVRMNMVHRLELQSTRRWTAVFAVTVSGVVAGVLRLLGV